VSSDPRPAEAFVHGDNAIVRADMAHKLLERGGFKNWTANHYGDDPEFDTILRALRIAAARRTSDLTSDRGSKSAAQPEVAPQLAAVINAMQAADLLGVTDRAIRLAIAGGKLPAQQVDGRWQINRQDVERYRATRRTA